MIDLKKMNKKTGLNGRFFYWLNQSLVFNSGITSNKSATKP